MPSASSGSHAQPPAERARLAATLAPLVSGAEPLGVRDGIAWLSSAGFVGVQLSATEPGMRPRDLSDSARRDLAATVARHELVVAGLDFLIPPAHFTDPTQLGRAVDAARGAIGLASFLGRAPVVIPGTLLDAPEAADALASEAERVGVRLVLAALEGTFAASADGLLARVGDRFDVGLDCAAALGAGLRPEAMAMRLGRRLGGVRLVDLLRSGLRGPILERGESRLDALALKVALAVSLGADGGAREGGIAAGGGARLPVVDARQWADPKRGLVESARRWGGLVG